MRSQFHYAFIFFNTSFNLYFRLPMDYVFGTKLMIDFLLAYSACFLAVTAWIS